MAAVVQIDILILCTKRSKYKNICSSVPLRIYIIALSQGLMRILSPGGIHITTVDYMHHYMYVCVITSVHIIII